MAITNYTQLKSSIASWLARSGDTDLDAVIPDFITLAEVRINRELRLRAMEDRIVGTVSTEFIALPTGFLEMRLFQLNTDPITRLEYVSPDWLARTVNSSNTGQPRYFTILNDEIQLGPAPDASYEAEMVFWKKFDALSDSTTTNWLLTNAPDVYLFGALAEGAAYLQDAAAHQAYDARYQAAVARLQGHDEKGKWSGALLVARPIGITVA